MSTSVEYMLNRDEEESKRLTMQHGLWVSSLNFHIQPRILSTIPHDREARIADVGTGTGVWLTTLASAALPVQASSAIYASYPPDHGRRWAYHGFDLSPAQFPPQDVLPANVHLHAPFDLKTPLPESSPWQGYFDVVHVRLVLLAVDPHEWPAVVQNLVGMLKPGGWLQWEEIDLPMSRQALSSDPVATSLSSPEGGEERGALTTGIDLLLDLTQPRFFGQTEKLHAAFHAPATGLEDQQRVIVSSDRLPTNRSLGVEMLTGVLRGVGRQTRGAGHKITLPRSGSDIEVDLERLLQDMKTERDRGWYFNFHIHCNTGRKMS